MADNKITIGEVETIVENAIIEDCGVTVESVKPNSDGDYCTVILEGPVYLRTLKNIAKAIGDEPIIGGEEYDKINLFFRIPDKDKIGTDNADELEPEAESVPAISDELRHKDKFYDSEDVVIPGTEMNCSNTEQCEQIKAWINETGHYPIIYIRLNDGIHVEVSDIYDRKVSDVLERGEAVGGDGHKYSIEKPAAIFPIGCSICVRATCIETGRNDVYDLKFFV